MAIEQLPDGRWKVDVEPIKGKRFRKTLKTKAEAQRFEATCRAKVIDAPDWSPKPKDKRRLSELVKLWFDLHGASLSDGIRRKAILDEAAAALGDHKAIGIDGAAIAAVRASWLAAGVSAKTTNNRLGYLKAVYNNLHALGVIDYPCPFAKLKPVKLQERPLSYLSLDQIGEALKALDDRAETSPHPPMIARICLATGARWGEAQALTPERIGSGVITFANTKSKRVWSVPISADLAKRLRDHWRQHGPFTQCMLTFSRVLETTSIRLPAGQATHVLRHTFASHFVMRGGNILVLQKILGHSSLTMTMRYAHLAPNHLQEALMLNPLDGFSNIA